MTPPMGPYTPTQLQQLLLLLLPLAGLIGFAHTLQLSVSPSHSKGASSSRPSGDAGAASHWVGTGLSGSVSGRAGRGGRESLQMLQQGGSGRRERKWARGEWLPQQHEAADVAAAARARRTRLAGEANGLVQGLKGLMRGRSDRIVDPQVTTPSDVSSLPTLQAMKQAMEQGGDSTASLLDVPLPEHPNIKFGQLDNGLRYIILPNQSPPQRFDAHLEVFTGSSDELEHEQGMAHLTEHVAYMGSKKREKLFGTGSQTNAYTDFHHTVFFANGPLSSPPAWGRQESQLPRALDALCDVLEAKIEKSRLEKERAAVLSEKDMVNNMDYRVECELLGKLHAENMLSRRFPIGKEELIRAWTPEDLKAFHRKHYRPSNAIVYVVGDVDVKETESLLWQTFGHLEDPKDAGPAGPVTLKNLCKHFPAITHVWSLAEDEEKRKGVPPNMEEYLKLPVMEAKDGKDLRVPAIFTHENLQCFSLHIFAKKCIEPVTDLASYRRSVMRRIAVAALGIRLSVNARTDAPFTMMEFNHLDSAREGCAVCYVDMTAEIGQWREATKLAVKEVRRLGIYGLTQSELDRLSAALLTDNEQLAMQGDHISNGEQLSFLMEMVSSQHTFMDTRQTYEASRLAVESFTLEEVNEVAAEMCEHLTHFGKPGAPQPSTIMACVPSEKAQQAALEKVREGSDSKAPSAITVTEQDLLDAVQEAVEEEVKPPSDIEVPMSFYSPDELQQLITKYNPHWVPFVDKETARKSRVEGQPEPTPELMAKDESTQVVQRKLSNGISVNIKSSPYEIQKGYMRVVVPGGRYLENIFGSGAVALGARAMQEGGAFGKFEREQVELFCIDHLLMVTIDTNEDFLHLDFTFPTNKIHEIDREDREGLLPEEESEDEDTLTGMEAAFQLMNAVLTGIEWEEDALNRARRGMYQNNEFTLKSLEATSCQQLMNRMSGGDERFVCVPREVVSGVTLEQARHSIEAQLTTDLMEISLVGDFEVAEVEDLILKYLGTIPPSVRAPELMPGKEKIPQAKDPASRHLAVHLLDSDERAVAYVAGSIPNRWGLTEEGVDVGEELIKEARTRRVKEDPLRSHPMFASAVLSVFREAVNRRLFSVVREQKRLTYDANLNLTSFERLLGSWYLITVTANPENKEKALQACKDIMESLTTTFPITNDNVESTKRVLINRQENDVRNNFFWGEQMSGIQMDCIPNKDISCLRDYPHVVNSVTKEDIQVLMKYITSEPNEVFTCIGTSGGLEREDDDVAPSTVGFRTGGSTMTLMH